jgi:hypothetical protein
VSLWRLTVRTERLGEVVPAFRVLLDASLDELRGVTALQT